MMRERWVMGNWKMHGSQASNMDLLATLKKDYEPERHGSVAIFPPSLYVQQAQETLTDTDLQWGGQNAHDQPQGAYTGEISMSMLRDLGCTFVLVGHSERRRYFSETNELLNKKMHSALAAGLRPVLCIGENRQEREQGAVHATLNAQLTPFLDDQELWVEGARMIVAYEPVWAIGTGLSATPQQAQEVHEYVRTLVAKKNLAIAENLTILYGGSVKANNASSLFAMPDIDGVLVGAASLLSQEFLEIAQCCKRLY